MEQNSWLKCPFCESKTRVQVRRDTVLEKFPLYCPKCKQTCVVTVREGIITNKEEPDA